MHGQNHIKSQTFFIFLLGLLAASYTVCFPFESRKFGSMQTTMNYDVSTSYRVADTSVVSMFCLFLPR